MKVVEEVMDYLNGLHKSYAEESSQAEEAVSRRSIDKETIDSMQTMIATLIHEKKVLGKKISMYEGKVDELEALNQNISAEKVEMSAVILEQKQQIQGLQKVIAERIQRNKTVEMSMEDSGLDLVGLEESSKHKDQLIQELTQNIQKLQKDLSLLTVQYKDELFMLTEKNKNYENNEFLLKKFRQKAEDREELKKKLGSCNERIEDLVNEMERVKGELGLAKELNEHLLLLKDEINRSEEKISSQTFEIERKNMEIKDLANELKRADESKAFMETRIGEYRTEIDNLRVQTQELNEHIESNLPHSESLAEIEHEIKITDLKVQNRVLANQKIEESFKEEQKRTERERDINRHKANSELLGERCKSLEEKNESLIKELENLRKLELTSTDLQREYNYIKHAYDAALDKISVLNKSLQEINSLKQERIELQSERNNLVESLQRSYKDKSEVDNSLVSSKDEYIRLSKECGQKENQISLYKKEIESLSLQHKHSQESQNTMTLKLEILERQMQNTNTLDQEKKLFQIEKERDLMEKEHIIGNLKLEIKQNEGEFKQKQEDNNKKIFQMKVENQSEMEEVKLHYKDKIEQMKEILRKKEINISYLQELVTQGNEEVQREARLMMTAFYHLGFQYLHFKKEAENSQNFIFDY